MKLSCLFGHKWDGCTCTRCGEVCPTGAIRRLTKEEKAKTKVGRAVLVPDWQSRCLAFKDGHPCALCERHCGYAAVKVVEEKSRDGRKIRRPVVDASACVGCGACAHVCPGGVPLVQYIRTAKVKLKELAAAKK